MYRTLDSFHLPEPAIRVHPYVVVLCYLWMVILNALSNIMYPRDQVISGYSYPYNQPDGATFAVWGIIYFFQAIFVIAQVWDAEIRNDERVILARPGYCMQCILNGLWLVANAQAYVSYLSSYWTAVAVLVSNVIYMFLGVYWYIANEVPLSSGSKAMEYDLSHSWGWIYRSKSSFKWRWFVWYPISFNLAWIVVAALLNISTTVFNETYLAEQPTTIGGPDWAIGVCYAASLLAIHNFLTRQDLGYAIVTIWALWGIYRNQLPESSFPLPRSVPLQQVCLFCIGLISLGIVVGWSIFYYRAYYDFKELKQAKDKEEENNSGLPNHEDMNSTTTTTTTKEIENHRKSDENESSSAAVAV